VSPEERLAAVGVTLLPQGRPGAKPNGDDEPPKSNNGDGRGAFDDGKPSPGEEGAKAQRTELLLSAWLGRELPPRDYLLGDVFCTTSRWLIFGNTGVGKTLFALSMAAAMAAGGRFLDWDGRRVCRVMYLDGELPAETFKERMQLIADEYGADLVIYGYNCDVLPDGEMPPLNTPEGEKWLWREIEIVRPDVIVLDSIMSLLTGTMGEEESWAPVKLLVRKISSSRIGQLWLHHTGHDTSKGFGTKTREWEMDTVVSLMGEENKPLSPITMEFKKARLRTPKTAGQFKPVTISRGDNGWMIVSDEVKTKSKDEIEIVKSEMLHVYDLLADIVATDETKSPTPGFSGNPVLKVKVSELRDGLRSRGFLETKDDGQLTALARKHFQRAKAALLARPKPRLFEKEGLIWKERS
jgi:hypothetical protein